MASLSLTENASKKVSHLLKTQENPEKTMLRLTIFGGGCSGFQYSFSLDDTVHQEDIIIESKGSKIIIDETSLTLVDGSEIDYKEEMIGSHFYIKNPNASTSCGCGNSFSI